MQWIASTLHTTSEHAVSSITTADAHTSAANSRLNRRPKADLNGLARFAERRNLVSAHVPSHFHWPLTLGDVKMLGCILKLDTAVRAGEMDRFTGRELRVLFWVPTGYCAVGLRRRLGKTRLTLWPRNYFF
jgi:hypothetical protein